MEIALNEGELPAMVPVPLYAAIRVGSTRNTDGDAFSIYLGLDEKMIQQLKMLSLDPTDTELDENTSDRKRFGEGSYEEWYSKKRVPFVLVHEGDEKLAAIVWYGPKPFGRKSIKHLSGEDLMTENAPSGDEWHTVSYRSYPPFRGKGVMKDFALATQSIYTNYFPQAKLWTGVNRNNPASVKLSEKLGFSIDESASDADWVAMVRI